MVRFAGLDVHKRFIEVCIIDRSGKANFRGRTGCTRDELIAFAKSKLKPTDQVALESTTNAWPVVEILRPFVARIVVGNPLKTKAIAEAKVKTDKVDAEVLAQLLRCDYLPEVWQPDDRTRQLRSWITHRTALMAHRGRLKNQIHGLLGRLLIHSPHSLHWTKKGRAWLQAIVLPPPSATSHDFLTVIMLQLIWAWRHPRANPGTVCYHGHITKSGNSQAHWLLTQAAQHASRHTGPLCAFFRRLTKRKNRSVAITALVRKLVTIAFLMLKNDVEEQ